MGDCDQLMPRYLRFVKGIMDAKRYVAQRFSRNPATRSAGHGDPSASDQKVLSTIAELQSKQPEDYRTLWTQLSTVLKEGLMSDFDNQDVLLRVSSFASAHSDEELTTLADYVERMTDGQEQIFYATGESREHLLKSPHLEAFKTNGYDVLLLTDPVDEIWVDRSPSSTANRRSR
jgi:molecular chaperone HtpG